MRGNRAEQHEAPTYTAMSPEQVPNIVKHTSFNQSRHRNVRVASLDPMPRDGELRKLPSSWPAVYRASKQLASSLLSFVAGELSNYATSISVSSAISSALSSYDNSGGLYSGLRAPMAAAASMMRRALARGDVEALVSGARAEQVLPPLYLVLPAEEDGGLDLFVTAYLVRVRQNGFMVMLPDLEAVRARLDALVNEDGESIPLQRRDQVQAETVRGRQLGPGRVILADFPWSGCEFFVKPTALRGMTDRASRVLTLSVGDVVARPSAADAQDTAGRWIDQLDPDTVQEYWASANDGGAEEEEAPDEEAPLAPPHPALLARTLPAGQSGQTRRPFQTSRGLSTAELDRLMSPAGGPPARTGTLERHRAPPNPPSEGGLHLEAEFGALPPAEVQDSAAELMDSTSTLQTLLLAQMRQNAVLLEKLVSGKHGDGIQEALAGAGGSGSESSSGIKGHLAREAFVKQVSDCKLVAAKVQENAMTELGLSATEPGMMRTYMSSVCRWPTIGCCSTWQPWQLLAGRWGTKQRATS
ncbi:hypothetical protein AK812_SmicGene904 [Symbiodinium microadriaticum]|uniref:Uncharacterized protein n=1 Tax=Symbiodinium microadriaticum TaxID=2951 RepID=A0A1Q9F5H3_SYMMI|nr:hypothetical protein AK812_SmicGene904 [Symbiodinium microadriaticum]